MERLTPELFLISAFDGDSDAQDTRALDFNLARRSGVVINRIIGHLHFAPDTTSGLEILGALVQEIDLDPDNVVTEFAAATEPDAVVVDSSRAFRQHFRYTFDTAAGLATPQDSYLIKDWHHVPANERPISITNLRHHARMLATVSCFYHVEIAIDYFIVELSLLEIGILNAGRR